MCTCACVFAFVCGRISVGVCVRFCVFVPVCMWAYAFYFCESVCMLSCEHLSVRVCIQVCACI